MYPRAEETLPAGGYRVGRATPLSITQHETPRRKQRLFTQPQLIVGIVVMTLGAALALPYFCIVAGGAGPMRLLFPVYALGVAGALIKSRRGLLLSFIIALFAFTPFLRRVIDLHAGFEAFNPVLLAPYAALLPTVPALYRRVTRQRADFAWPFVLLVVFAVYAIVLALLAMRTTEAVYESLRWLLPVSFCAFIMDRPRELDELRRSLFLSLRIILPVVALYGMYQYLSPPLWDTFWMTNVHNGAFGYPEPYGIRVFSTMNSPMSVGLFAVSAMILLSGEGIFEFAIAAIGLPLLAITMLREAWIIYAISIIALMMLAPAAQKMKLILGVGIVVFAGMVLINSHTFSPDAINQVSRRFSSLSDVNSGTDTSAGDRLTTYTAFFDRLADHPLGEGFGANASTASDAGKRDLPPLDSAILESALTLGVPLGALYFITMGALVFVACRASKVDRRQLSACSALVIGIVATSPIGANLIGEASILTWVAIGFLLANAELANRHRRRSVATAASAGAVASPIGRGTAAQPRSPRPRNAGRLLGW